MESLGNKITALRKKANITQDELAAELEVTRQAVSQWEQDLSTPKADKLKALCEYFNVRPDYFLFENSEMQPLVTPHEEFAVSEDWHVEQKEKLTKKTVIIICAVIISVIAALGVAIYFAWYFMSWQYIAENTKEYVCINTDVTLESNSAPTVLFDSLN